MYCVSRVGELVMAMSTKPIITKTIKSISPALPDSYLDSSYATGFGSPAVRKTILRMYRERQPQDFVGWEDKWLAVAKQKPIIVLWGDKDPFITPAYAERFGG